MTPFGRLQSKTARSLLRRPPRPAKSERARMQRMAFARHALRGEATRDKAAITLPKLRFLGDEI